MKKWLARKLREAANRFDPPSMMIELLPLDPVEGERIDDALRGYPCFFWMKGENTFSIYPHPDGPMKLYAQRVLN